MRKTLTRTLYSRLERDKALFDFVNKLMTDSEVYLFGGAVRDYIDNNLVSFRDLDFVIKSKSCQSINIEDYIPAQTKFVKNRYNGYKIYFSNVIVDIWNIENTWAFENHKLSMSVENLLKSVYLNIDSLVYLLNEDRYINNCDKLYKNIIFHKQLDVVCKETPFELLNLLRAIIYKNKYSLRLSENLKQQFYKYITTNEAGMIEEFMRIQKEHYKKSIISKSEILSEINYIKNSEFSCL